MSERVADFLVQRLHAWGVRRIFGYPGDGINGVMGALDRHQDLIQFVQVRHEEMAAFMACAHAKFTGELGVCLGSSGPGSIHLLNGLYDAKMDNQPVLALLGQVKRGSMGTQFQQEVDLQALFKEVAYDFVQTAMVPEQIRHLIDRSIRIALANRTVTALILPHDLQEAPVKQSPPRTHGMTFSGMGYRAPKILPAETDLEQAADVLNAGKKVAMLVGAGALAATDEVIAVADTLGAGIAKALLGLASVPDDEPVVVGSLGLLGTQPAYEMMQECDTLLMIGSNFPYSEFLPKEGQARGVQIDLKPSVLSLRYPMEVNLVGDSAETLKALLPLLEKKTDRSWQLSLQHQVQRWWKLLERRAMVTGNALNPQRVYWELSPLLPENAILTADTGTSTIWFAQYLKMRRGMRASLSGSLASMGAGIPYAIAAKFAEPHRSVIAFVGDGAMEMNGNAELLTIAKYWRTWEDPRLIVLVLNNRDLNFVTWEMRVMGGNRKFSASQDVPDFPYANYAQSIGLAGIRLEKPADIIPGLKAALTSDRPVVIEAITDPHFPPIPPHISFEQAQHFTAAMLKGDPDAWQVMRISLLEIAEDLFTHSEKPSQ